MCLDLLGATDEQRNRFKMSQIIGEAVDEFISKMRITGVISFRGNGRFIDFNSFESEKIEYILNNYSNYETYANKSELFEYMGAIDSTVISLSQPLDETTVSNVRIETLEQLASEYSKEDIINELNVVCGHGESRNPTLKIIDKPTRLEFLTSIALKQYFEGLTVRSNYHVDDKGLPTYTTSGGMTDIECFCTNCNPLVEVTLMCARNQATNEMSAITRHLQEAIEKQPNVVVLSVLIAPTIHADTKYIAGFSKFQYGVDIFTLTISEFIKQIQNNNRIIEMFSQQIYCLWGIVLNISKIYKMKGKEE